MVNNLPSNAGDLGLIPAGGTKFPRAPGKLNTPPTPCTTAGEPVGCNQSGPAVRVPRAAARPNSQTGKCF